MSISYLIAKYVDDLGRNEPRNVGVVVYDGEHVVARFDGEDEAGKFNLGTIRYRVPANRTYRSWVAYWRGALENPQRLDPSLKGQPAGSDAIIERLVGVGSPDFYLEHGGAVLLDLDQRSLDQTAQELFDRLVQPAEEPAAKTLRQNSEDALKLAGAPVEDESRFKTDFPVTFNLQGTMVPAEFSFAVQNGTWHYLQEVSFDPKRAKFSQKEVMNAVVLFEHGGWERNELAVLYDGTAVGHGQYRLIELLLKFAPTVDVANPEQAAEKLHDRLGLQ